VATSVIEYCAFFWFNATFIIGTNFIDKIERQSLFWPLDCLKKINFAILLKAPKENVQ
jgi:hypothetical protein